MDYPRALKILSILLVTIHEVSIVPNSQEWVATKAEQKRILDYCHQLALHISASPVSFNLNDAQLLNQENAAEYDPSNRQVTLSVYLQQEILKNCDQHAIMSDALFVLLHELGHHDSYTRQHKARRDYLITLCAVAPCCGMSSFKFLEISQNVGIPFKKALMITFLGVVGVTTATVHALGQSLNYLGQFLEERAADRYAAEKLVQLYGFENAQSVLQALHTLYPSYGTFFTQHGFGQRGYQGYDTLLRHIQTQHFGEPNH